MPLLDMLPLAWWQTDPGLRITAEGGAAARHARGCDPAGRMPEVHHHGPDRLEPPALDTVMHGHALAGRTVRWRAKSAGRLLDVAAGPRRDAAGRVVGISALAVDTTAAALERERYAALAAYLPAAAFIRDADERYLWVNEAYAHLYGAPPTQIVGRSLAEVVPPEDVQRFRSLDRQVMACAQPMRHRLSFLRPGGGTGQAVGHRFPLAGPAGGCVAGIYVDVTDHARTLQVKARMEEDLFALRDRSGAASLTLSLSGSIERASPGAAELLATTVAALEASDLRDHLAPLPPAEAERLLALWRALARGRSTRGRLRLRCRTASGALRMVRVDLAVARSARRPVRLLTLMVPLGAEHPMVPRLAPIQQRVLLALARGESNAQISSALNVSRQALDYHLRRLRVLLDAPSRPALVARGYTLGLLDASVWPPAFTT
ncbi:PAS domain-containing protein [Streptomyces sp. NPDC085932]|uniref:PAS domain-containing protein n=1 Tax=Streptomyces sp. NPDC085932 TaxID=3365741 RepID=UPI0037D586E9